MALGALIGGLLLAGTEYRRQVEVTIEPFKGLAVGVFLISVGMSLDFRALGTQPLLVLVAVVCVVLLKLLVVTGLARAFGLNWAQSLRTGLLLGAGGEFAFVIVSVASGEHLLAPDVAQVLVFVTALTMATIPLLSRLGGALAPRLASEMPVDPNILVPQVSDALPRVIIAGFGRVGQTVAALLEAHKVRYVAVDRDADRRTDRGAVPAVGRKEHRLLVHERFEVGHEGPADLADDVAELAQPQEERELPEDLRAAGEPTKQNPRYPRT
jgi:CPA2 family monovalent cation:H+ antiporter-2